MSDSPDDLRKKFKGTNLFLELNGKKHLVQYTEDNGEDCFTFYSPDYGEILIDYETVLSSLTYEFPQNGLYNINKTAMEFFRVPERQWKRAPAQDNSRMISILDKIGISLGVSTDITLNNLEELYKKLYPKNLDEAIKTLKYSLALNKDFAISQSKEESDSILLFWMKSQPIGTINTATREVSIKYNPLYQEALDFFRKKETSWHLLPKAKQS
jgi:hypothetical protein